MCNIQEIYNERMLLSYNFLCKVYKTVDRPYFTHGKDYMITFEGFRYINRIN